MKHIIRIIPCEKLNEYIQGRISGIIYALSGMPEIGYAWMRRTNGVEYMRFDCTDEQFALIKETIGKLYGDFIKYELE